MNFLDALAIFIIGAIIGYAWLPVWSTTKKIYNNAYEKTYRKRPPYEL